MHQSGIYVIRNLKVDRVYVGSSVNLQRRLRNHKKALLDGKHHNEHLQRSWTLHGCNNFVFEIVEECEPSKRVIREQFWIDKLKASHPDHGYNVMHTVRGTVPSPRRSQISKEMWKNPEFAAHIRKRRQAMGLDPAFLEKTSAAAKSLWATPEHREKMKLRDERLRNDNGFKALRRKLANAQWESQEQRDKIAEAAKRQWSDEATRKRVLEAQKEGRENRDFSGTMRRIVADQWKDPEFRAARCAALKAGQAKRKARLLAEAKCS